MYLNIYLFLFPDILYIFTFTPYKNTEASVTSRRIIPIVLIKNFLHTRLNKSLITKGWENSLKFYTIKKVEIFCTSHSNSLSHRTRVVDTLRLYNTYKLFIIHCNFILNYLLLSEIP